MTILSKLKRQPAITVGVGTIVGLTLMFSYFKKSKIKSTNGLDLSSNHDEISQIKVKGKSNLINVVFLNRLKILLKIIFPQFLSRETLLLFSHTLFLVIRTFLSIYVASLEGKLVKSIVQRDVTKFIYLIGKFLLMSLPATFVNSLIKFLEIRLGLAFRSRLVQYFYKRYFSNQIYYRESLDSRIKNVDQSLTDDIAAFSSSLSHIYSQVTKPFLDLCLMNVSLYHLANNRGASTKIPSIIALIVVLSTSEFLRFVSPKFGVLVNEEAKRKGVLRYVHSRIIQNAEEIAFYNGHEVESNVLWQAYQSLVSQIKTLACQKLWYVTLEQFLMKYVWSASGLCMVSIPILTATGRRIDGTYVDDDPDGGVAERTQGFTIARNLLLSASSALERMISSYKEIIELSGYTDRVYELLQVFNDLSIGKYQQNDQISPLQTSVKIEYVSDYIELINVPIVTPNGDIVLPDLSLKICRGDHTFITGPNGCGKSSLFRIFHGLWPVRSGILRLPSTDTLYHIPQKPYMFLGTLRDQIIYPDSLELMRRKSLRDEDLDKILAIVQLEHILLREGGFNAKKDWINVLSGGEKQRIGIARIFYHKPMFALLDECTSAVSIDAEANIYQAMLNHNITLLTITHRPSLRKFHKRILQFDGEGHWEVNQI